MESIIKKYLEGIASEAEQSELLLWLRDKNNRQEFNRLKYEWKKNLTLHPFSVEGEETWSKIQEVLLKKNYQGLQLSRKIQIIYRYAAIFFFIMTIGSIAYMVIDWKERVSNYADNGVVKLNTRIFADNGQISKVELPDGSKLWLNSGSEVSHNNQYGIGNREITLSGEAYFEVAEDKTLPFIVKCNLLIVKALGTKFNVSGYPGAKMIDVVLVEGLLELKHKELKNFSQVLEPEQRARFNMNERSLLVEAVNATKLTSWKDGIINIYNQPLREVLRQLELRYNQKFTIEEELKDYHYTFSISNETLEEVIKLMEKITPVKAVQQNNIINFKLDKRKIRKTGK